MNTRLTHILNDKAKCEFRSLSISKTIQTLKFSNMKHLLVILISLFSITTAFADPDPSVSNTFNANLASVSLGSDPGTTTPEQVRARLAAINTEIELRYDATVQSTIDSFLKQSYGRKRLASLLNLASYYFPIFEKALKEAGLPEELKYLPIVESGLKAKATSHAGAGGLWQFMPATARGYDMTVNSTLDERADPYVSSEKACALLKKLYEKFGDWGLALAAYNCGPGTMQKVLRRAGGDPKQHNFWTVINYLPAETRKYVPKFIAMTYVFTYYTEHGMPKVNVASPLRTDTIRIAQKGSLKKVASMVDLPIEDIKNLNPHFSTDVIPSTSSRPCTLILPVAHAREYKIQLGRTPQAETIAEANFAPGMSTQPTPQPVRQMQQPVRQAQQTVRRDTWNDSDYEDVASKGDPNVKIRQKKAKSVNKEGRFASND